MQPTQTARSSMQEALLEQKLVGFEVAPAEAGAAVTQAQKISLAKSGKSAAGKAANHRPD